MSKHRVLGHVGKTEDTPAEGLGTLTRPAQVLYLALTLVSNAFIGMLERHARRGFAESR
ncbi:hypothetical protein [Achromobacter sp.]|uniref:hypothetical protein n=1 Tax=Achromobacter sp. TaxID=134375 RepID=UPI0031DFD498